MRSLFKHCVCVCVCMYIYIYIYIYMYVCMYVHIVKLGYNVVHGNGYVVLLDRGV